MSWIVEHVEIEEKHLVKFAKTKPNNGTPALYYIYALVH